MLFRVFIVIVALLAVLAAVHVALDIYLRWERRRRLEAEHAEGQGQGLSREDYVARGLARYDREMPKKLIVAVLAAPVLVLVGLILLAGG